MFWTIVLAILVVAALLAAIPTLFWGVFWLVGEIMGRRAEKQ